MQTVEVNSRGNLLTQVITSVPVRRPRARHIEPLLLEPEIQRAHQIARHVVNLEGDVCRIFKLIWNPCFRIERIWEVLQQLRQFSVDRYCQA